MDVSIVIPLYNESESLIELNEWINKSLISSGFSYEIIYIDDGSDDQSWNIIVDIAKEENEKLTIVRETIEELSEVVSRVSLSIEEKEDSNSS